MLVCGTIRAQMNDVHNEIAKVQRAPSRLKVGSDSNVTYYLYYWVRIVRE